MAISEEARLLVRITAENASQQVFAKFDAQLKGLQQTAVGLGTAIVGALSLREVVNSTRRLGNEIDTLRDNLGLTGKQASILNYQARVMGTNAEEVSGAFGALNRKLIDQLPLLEKGESDFDKWSVQVRDARGDILPFDQVLENVSNRLRELPAGFGRSGAAMDLLGRNGRQLLDLLTASDEQLSALGREAEELGLILSDAGVDSLEEFNRDLNRLDLHIDALKLRIGQFLVPVLRELLNWLRANAGAIKSFFEEVRKAWGAVKEFAAGIQAFIGKVKEKGLVGALIDEFRDRFPELTKIWDEWFAPGTGKIPKSFSSSGAELQRVWGPGGVVGTAFSEFGTKVREILDGLLETIPKVITKFGELFTGAPLVGGVFAALSFIVDKLSHIGEFLDGAASVTEKLKTLFAGVPIVGGIFAALDFVVDKLNHARELLSGGLLDSIAKFFGWQNAAPSTPATRGESGLEGDGRSGAGAGGGGGRSWRPGDSTANPNDRPATLDDIYAAFTRNHGYMPDFAYAKMIEAGRPMWSQVQNLASGGIVQARPGGTLARIGEGGRDEAVIPLSGGMGGLGGISIGSIVINGSVDSRDRVDEVAEAVAGRLLELAGSMGPLRYR